MKIVPFKTFCQLILVSLLLTACNDTHVDDNPHEGSSGNTVNIALIVTLVSFGRDFGNDMYDGANLAAKEINSAGGLNGQKINVIARDSACDGDIATFELEALIQDFDIAAVVGPVCSSATVALNNITSTELLPLISLYATSPAVTTLEDNDTIYRMEPSDTNKGFVYAQHMIDNSITRLGIIFRDDPFNAGLAEIVRDEFEDPSQGREVVSYVPYEESQTVEFTEEVNELFAPGNLDAVAIFGFADSAGNIAVAIQVFNPDDGIQYYFSDPTPELANFGAPSIIDGSIGVFLADISDEIAPNFTTFEQNFLAFSNHPDAFPSNGALAYDAVYLHALAMLQGGDNTRSAILGNLSAVSGTGTSPDAVMVTPNEFEVAITAINDGKEINYEGASGPINWDENGDIRYGNYSILEAQMMDNGFDYVEIETIQIIPP